MGKSIKRVYDEKLLRVKVLSHNGDKIHIKLPVNFVKKMIQNNALDFFNDLDDIVDGKKLISLVTRALDENISGEVAHLERKNGDIIKIILD
ncbi:MULTISPECIES: hypothetical protein [Romboutsia]|uniref:Uncharacterized protein n=1 Tax=Romboutsia hominis TaxID=1507512 RepID=A0A2P2BSP2_9FIRM|nr:MULTISPECIES: hypothetical protein [Romboutsia]MCH1960674.1 hypothetical protein [Romboutsia hominis]MCH1968894.1 hypothetical protein [Romboutsia hominis]MDB8793586.1 hypothetical protein [Romboutsia sp. 1001216sp1]MDB8794983.1 hypothetical protein [Romboutsia sp. 1001216sp1]MDB8798794.1 hypothetical protein [Romboutsia sp. 1001216sp1]